MLIIELKRKSNANIVVALRSHYFNEIAFVEHIQAALACAERNPVDFG